MMEKFMGRMSILAILLLITSIVCDDNNVTTPLSTTPLTSSTPSSISVTSSTSTTTVAPQLSENTTKPAQVPPTSTLSSNRKQLASPSCNCDLTVTKFKHIRVINYAHISFHFFFSILISN